MEEQWKTIPEYPDYEISNYGRVKSHKFHNGTNERILKGGTAGTGYHHVCLTNHYGQTCKNVHKLVIEAFLGPCPEGLEAIHSDSNKLNNHIDNLRYGTRFEKARYR